MSGPSLRVTFAPDANRDLVDQADFLSIEAGLAVSNRFIQAVAHTVDLLSQMPGMGRVFRPANNRQIELRTIPVSRPFHRSVIFYTSTATQLRIERILHSAQNLHRFFP